MTWKIQIRDLAVEDIQTAKSWYDENLLGLGDKFLSELKSTLLRIIDNPLMHGNVNSEVRFARLQKFP
jgi:hypothetical protein